MSGCKFMWYLWGLVNDSDNLLVVVMHFITFGNMITTITASLY